MRDSYGRDINYMRISITDACNLRCGYCMPENAARTPAGELLTAEEILRVASCAAELGIRYLRVTGGEPLMRPDCCQLISTLKAIPGIEKVTLTTNGTLLGKYLPSLVQAGIDGVNISLDTSNRRTYAAITGQDALDTVTENIRLALASSIPVKINAVSLALGDENRRELIEFARNWPVDVRFIEWMPVGEARGVPAVSHEALWERLQREYPGIEEDMRVHGAGPAHYYRLPGFTGCIGLISAMHRKFCGSCNRVRLTSRGFLKTCLCYEDGVDLKGLLRGKVSGETGKELLRETMRRAISRKPAEHCFESPGEITETRSMAEIGG